MKDLLRAGANPTLASVDGQTPLHTAAQVRPGLAAIIVCSIARLSTLVAGRLSLRGYLVLLCWLSRSAQQV